MHLYTASVLPRRGRGTVTLPDRSGRPRPHRPAPRAGLRDLSLRPGAFPPGAAAPGSRLRPLRRPHHSLASSAHRRAAGRRHRGRKCLRSPRGGRRGRSGGGARRRARLRPRARPAGRRAARGPARRGAHRAAPAGRARPAPAPRRGERGAPAGRCPVRVPVELHDCLFTQAPDLRMAEFSGLALTGCRVPGLRAGNLRVAADLLLNDGFTAHGPVDLTDAHVGGSLRLSAGRLTAAGGRALIADRVVVEGTCYARRLSSNGELRLPGAPHHRQHRPRRRGRHEPDRRRRRPHRHRRRRQPAGRPPRRRSRPRLRRRRAACCSPARGSAGT